MRKLFLLLVTICMAMAPGGDIAVTQLQCLTSILLLLLFLALHLWITPYRRSLVNRLEAMCQLATTVTFGLLMFLTLEDNARAYIIGGNSNADSGALAKALIGLIIAMNMLVLLYLFFQAARLVYKVLRGMPTVQQWHRRMVAVMGHIACCACLGCVVVEAR